MLKVNLVDSANYNPSQLGILAGVFGIIERQINSPAFEQAVRRFKTNGRPTFSYKRDIFRSFPSYTNDEVFEMIKNAREIPGNITDGQIDLYLVLEPGSDGQNNGFGNQGEKEIHTYEGYFNVAKPEQLANHIVHEWCHKLGFLHAKFRWMDSNRDTSAVPYAIGNLIEELYKSNL
jgi:hypothetical protein